MVQQTQTISRRYLMAFVAALLLAAGGNAPAGQDAAQNAVEGSEMTVVTLPTDDEVEELYDGDGMKIPLDGSSVENFEASLALVKKHSPEPSYISLENAIEYLLVYDLAVRRNKEKLAAKLNGSTGYEVKAMVGWRKPPPGKSKAVKGSSDANLIDS